VVLFAALAGVAPAGAAQLEQPTGASPYQVTLDGGSHPRPFAVVVSGFAPGQQVFIEQCDAINPSTPTWDPTIDCDSGSSPAPVVVGSDGRATFAPDDANHRFTPFVGVSPQSEFSCLAAGGPVGNPSAAVPSYASCQVRVSSNNATITSDQVMFPIALPAGATPPPVGGATSTTTGATSSTASGGSSTSASASGASTTLRPAAGDRTSVGSASGSAAGGRGHGSSAHSIAWLIGAIVVVAGAGGYLWAWRRKRPTTTS
jgi:hypothetical protein